MLLLTDGQARWSYGHYVVRSTTIALFECFSIFVAQAEVRHNSEFANYIAFLIKILRFYVVS